MAVVRALFIQPLELDWQPRHEIIPIARLLGRPADFAQSAQTRKDHVFKVPQVGDPFGPDVALRTEDAGIELRIQAGGNRLERVNLTHCNGGAADRLGFGGAVGG